MNFVLSLNTKEDVLKNMSRPTSIAYGKRHTFDALKQLTTNTKLAYLKNMVGLQILL